MAIMLSLSAMAGYSWAQDASGPPEALYEPNVVIKAEPPPPFIYWAPHGATILNHPRDPMMWIAESEDGSRKYYFEDQCHASQFQRFVGQQLNVLPDKPDGAT